MSDKQGPPPTSPYGAGGAPGGVSYPQMMPPQGAPPPSYVESLTHQVVPGGSLHHQYSHYASPATAAAASAQLQNYKEKQERERFWTENMAAAQQAQKIALSQQAFQQQQAALYMQQQQQLYLQQLQGMYQTVPTTLQPGQNVLIMNGYDSGARFDGIAQPSIPPPPPGVAPNAAQLAAASGAQVSMSQKKSSFLTGGTGGGYTFF